MSIIGVLLSWTGMPQWAKELLALILAGFGAWGAIALYNHHERAIGAAACVAEVHSSNAQVATHNAEVAAKDSTVTKDEAKEYEIAMAAPVLRPVRVYIVAPTLPNVPATGAAGQSADEAAPDRGADHGGPVPTQPFGPELQEIGKGADAQIAGLQDYINRVCRAR